MMVHLWQSTLCVVAAWLLTMALRRNRAAVRYGLWLAASVKFLVPFSLLVSLGRQFGWRTAPAIDQSQLFAIVDQIGRPFALPVAAQAPAAASQASNLLPAVLWGVWFCGSAIAAMCWMRWWRQMRAARQAAAVLDWNLAIPTMSSPSPLEPGVFGILDPVLLLPEGITDRLTAAQLELILAHELCHVRRRDNLTAAIHMVVETVFWFHPLVWWIGARLVEERERACDEEVLRAASDPNIYAEGILNVCRFYLSSPLACAAGVTGSDLKKRIEAIVANRAAYELSIGRRVLLIAAALLAVAGPVAMGIMGALPSRGQTQAETAPRAFEAASVKPNRSSDGITTRRLEPGSITYLNITLGEFIAMAYGVKHYQLSGPDWIVDYGSTDRYDVVAKAGGPSSVEEVKRMLGPLLAERFHLKCHRETRELTVYALVVAKGGPKFKQPGDGGEATVGRDGEGGFAYKNYSMANLADWLAILPSMERPVIDRTRLEGVYSFHANLFNFPKGMPAYDTKMAMRDRGASDLISAALPEQLGLKLESQKAPIEVLVIEHADKAPTENLVSGKGPSVAVASLRVATPSPAPVTSSSAPQKPGVEQFASYDEEAAKSHPYPLGKRPQVQVPSVDNGAVNAQRQHVTRQPLCLCEVSHRDGKTQRVEHEQAGAEQHGHQSSCGNGGFHTRVQS